MRSWVEAPPVSKDGRQAFLKALFFVYCQAPEEPAWIDAANSALLATQAGDGVEFERSFLLSQVSEKLAIRGRLDAAERLLAHEFPSLEPARAPYLAWVLYSRGLLRKLQGLPKQALEDYRRAAELPDPYGGALAETLRVETAGVYLELGLADLARRELGQSQDLNSQLQRARIELYSGRCEAVLRRAESALANALDEEHAGIQSSFRLQQAIAYSEKELPDKARPMLDELCESAQVAEVERMEARLQLAILELRQGNTAAARNHLRLQESAKLTPLQKARWAATRARCERLLGATRGELLDRRSDLERAQEDCFRLWAETPILDSGVAFLQYDIRRASLGERITLDLELDGPKLGAESGLALILRAQTLGTLARQLKLAVPTLAELRKGLIPAQGGLLILLPAPFGSHLFVVDSKELGHHALPPSGRIEAALKRYSRAISQRPATAAADEWVRASHALVAELLPPEVLARIRNWKSISTIGFDSFGFAPLEALEIPGLGVLGDQKVISSLPSVPVGLLLQQRSQGAGSGVRRMLLAPQIPGAVAERWKGLQPIPWGAEQTRELLEVLGTTKWELRFDAEATRERFLAPCEELVLLTHGVEDLERNQPAGLVLAGAAAPLFAEDILGLAAAPKLVLLACCGAGRGVVRRGDEGLNNLGGALHTVGVPTVIFSAADLDYDSTRVLLLEFLRARTAGAQAGEALRRARAQLAADKRWAHPYYRSLLVLSGLASQG